MIRLDFFTNLMVFAICATVLIGCKSKNESEDQGLNQRQNTQEQEKGLKDYYANYFPMGVAVAPNSVEGESAEFILTHFNSITPENAMKMGSIHPEKDRFYWKDADKIVEFAQENDLKIRGHALVWHQQTGDWIFEGENGEEIDKKELLARMEAHVDSVVTRYKGKIYAWDVVNEAISDDPSEFLRESKWYEIAGADFITKAFEYANQAAPEAKLFYNDYNAVIPEKRDRIYKLLKQLLENDVPIDGMGIQGHWSIYGPSEEELRKALDMYSSLGLEVQITELDVSIYPWEKEQRELRPGESDEFTPELEQKQLEKYDMFFRVFRDYKDVITGVTFWNLSDKHSWLDSYPVEGRKNYPLLFDEEMKPKKVYWEVVDFPEDQE